MRKEKLSTRLRFLIGEARYRVKNLNCKFKIAELDDWTYKFYDPDGSIAKRIQTGQLTIEQAMKIYHAQFRGVLHHKYNVATSVGIKALIYWMANGSGSGASFPTAPSPTTLFNNAGAKIAVGTGTGAAAQGDTYATLTSPVYLAIDSGFPNLSAATPWILTYQATAAAGTASQAWNEFALTNGNSSPVIFNRYVVSKGTKDAAESWVAKLNFTFS